MKPGCARFRLRNRRRIALWETAPVGDGDGLMASNLSDSPVESPASAPQSGDPAELDFTRPARPIAEFVERADFPDCAQGEHIDISGFTGIVVAVVKHSLKVKPPEGLTQSFNANRLRTLFAPPVRIEAQPAEPARTDVSPESAPRPVPRRRAEVVEDAEPAAQIVPVPVREVIEEPDFAQAVLQIRDVVGRDDFPKCAFGLQLEINGFTGVVVEIVKQSLRVRSSDGYLQSFNGPILKKLHGGA